MARTKVDNEGILAGLKNDPKVIKQLVANLDNAQHYMMEIDNSNNAIKDIVEEASEATGLSKAFLKKLAKARLEGNSSELLSEVEALVEAVDLTGKPHVVVTPQRNSNHDTN